jgi:hypothetical protein
MWSGALKEWKRSTTEEDPNEDADVESCSGESKL